MTPDALKQLIASDATATDLAKQGRDAECAARCTAISPKVMQSVPNRDVKRHAILAGYWSAVQMVSDDKLQPAEKRGLAIAVGAWVNDSDATTDFTLPQVQGMLAGLVAYGMMSTAQRDSLLVLAQQPQTVTASEVSNVFAAERAASQHQESDK